MEEGLDQFIPGKRARYSKTGGAEFEVVNRPTFTGGFLQVPILLNITRVDGTVFMKVTGREDWLAMAATGKKSRPGVWERGVANVRDEIFGYIGKAGRAARAGSLAAASAGRKILEMPDDSDSSAEDPTGTMAPKPDISSQKVDKQSMRQVREIEFRAVAFRALKKKKVAIFRGT